MVNQKLGKICISYDKLEKRHRSTTMLTHDLTIMDLFCMIAIPDRPSIKQSIVDFVNVISRLLKSCSSFFKLPSVIEVSSLRADHLLDDLFRIHSQLRMLHGLPSSTRKDFDAQYSFSYA